MSLLQRVAAALLIVVALTGVPSVPSVVLPPLVAPSVTAVVYVYEKDETAVPAGVTTGLNWINREKRIPATMFERDTKDGSGETPEQYRVPLAAAQAVGLPALVVLSGTGVAKTVKNPATEADVVEAVP